MRYTFAREGATTIVGVLYEPGAFELPEGPLDVSLGPDLTPDTLFGTAYDFRREDNGSLTCEIELEDDADPKMVEMLGSEAFLTTYFNKHLALFEQGLKTVKWVELSHLFLYVGPDPWVDAEEAE